MKDPQRHLPTRIPLLAVHVCSFTKHFMIPNSMPQMKGATYVDTTTAPLTWSSGRGRHWSNHSANPLDIVTVLQAGG